MVDSFSPDERSRIMGRIRGRDTMPELRVRRALKSLGVGYRVDMSGVPGRPDIVMMGRRKVIFVHGCFWHGHTCKKGHLPKSNEVYWTTKIGRNIERDARNQLLLMQRGWSCLVIWECELKNEEILKLRLQSFLASNKGGDITNA